MAYKDLRKVKGDYGIRKLGLDEDIKATGRVYVGYEIHLVDRKDAWKFKTRDAAMQGIRDADLSPNQFMAIAF